MPALTFHRARPRPLAALAAVLALAAARGLGAAEEVATPAVDLSPPAWFLAHVEAVTAGGGRWLTDNAAYRSDQEPYDGYGIEWTKGLGGRSLEGRLFGLKDGAEVGSFWKFFVVWHPGQRRVEILQVGPRGAFGTGWLAHVDQPAGIVAEQEFFYPTGETFRSLEVEEDGPGGTRINRSYVWREGAWKLNRSYTWRLAPAG